MAKRPDKDRAWKDAAKHPVMKAIRGQDSHVKIGVLAEKGGAVKDADGVSAVELAAIHEFGAPKANIPERSFLRRTLHERANDLEKVMGNLAKQVVDGTITMEVALNQLGAVASSWVKNTIAENRVTPPTGDEQNRRKNLRAGQPPDAPTTTLVDTGRMMNAITWLVKMERERRVKV